MTLSQIIGPLTLAGLVLISVIEGSSLPQSCDIQNPLIQSQSQPEANEISKAHDWFPKALDFKLTDASALGVHRALPETLAAQEPERITDSNYRLQKVQEWRMAVAQHNPGKPDPAAVKIGSWQGKDLDAVIGFVTKLASQPIKSARRTLAKARIRRSLDLTDQEVQQGDLNRILKQGALLHTDIALLELEAGVLLHTSERTEALADGLAILQPKKLHWELARQLIDSFSPLPSHDQMARQWYIATTAHMQSRRLLVYAGQNLKHALKKFPSDDRILFYAGVLHEIWASPVNQNVLLPRGVKTSYGSEESELREAREFFQKAVAANPRFAEAHLRLGRVLGLLGHHSQAVAELQQAAASIQDPQLLYYTSLYLGYEFAMLSCRQEARDQYERAAMLYPTAQSPLLALSQLAAGSGDAEGALIALQRVFALPIRDFWKDDPWWVYDLAHVRDATALVAELHKVFGELPR
jgi:tetratricopeptide (TPR) repeat protein